MLSRKVKHMMMSDEDRKSLEEAKMQREFDEF
jgi:hypothetical protein